MSIDNNTGNKEKIDFYLPGFYDNAALICMMADFVEHIPQWFYDDFKISAAYGSFPNCIWNGGRTTLGAISRTMMEKTVEEFNKRGIAVRYTFTNPLLEEKHMNDTFANLCLEVADNGMNEVLVNTQVIEDYIRENYPGYKILSSTTKCLRTIEQVEAELEKDYFLVVLDSSLNKDERIFSLKEKGRLEVLADHGCRLNCPNSKNHYIASGKGQLNFDYPKFPACPYVAHTKFEDVLKKEHSIPRDLMNEKYIPNGIKHFKLDGRSFNREKLVDSFMHYMVKPEYQEKMKAIIKKEVYGNEDW